MGQRLGGEWEVGGRVIRLEWGGGEVDWKARARGEAEWKAGGVKA
jgi:hypothetical protein